MICFQILSLTTFLQDMRAKKWAVNSCDLLSNFIFDNVLTSEKSAFCLRRCCDLLSNFIFDNVLTSAEESERDESQLWFAFKFYLWQRSYKSMSLNTPVIWVVICFQILSLTTFLQVQKKASVMSRSCDLLSNFIFDNVLTRKEPSTTQAQELWFAFKFYLWQRSYKHNDKICCWGLVVICFQILSLTTFLQELAMFYMDLKSCDLLSNFIFDNVLTSYQCKNEMDKSCDLLSNFIFDNVLTSAI